MTALPTELIVLGWSVVLLLAYIAAQGATALRVQGLRYNAGPRDEERPLGTVARRARRALSNFMETYPAFVGLALALAVSGRAGGIAAAGAIVWIIARILFLPLYLAGIPWLRSAAFGASIIGLVLMLVRLLTAR